MDALRKAKWFTGSRTLSKVFIDNPWVTTQLLGKIRAAVMYVLSRRALLIVDDMCCFVGDKSSLTLASL